MKTLTNTTVLSNFAAVQRLDLLRLRWGELYIAYSVYGELQAGLQVGYNFLVDFEEYVFPTSPAGWIHVVELEGEEEPALYKSMPARLHRGKQCHWRLPNIVAGGF